MQDFALAFVSLNLADLVPQERNSSSSWEALENSVVAVPVWQCGDRAHCGGAWDPVRALGSGRPGFSLGLTDNQVHEPLLQDSAFSSVNWASSWGAESQRAAMTGQLRAWWAVADGPMSDASASSLLLDSSLSAPCSSWERPVPHLVMHLNRYRPGFA